MSDDADGEREVAVVYRGGAASLTPEMLDCEIRRVWSELTGSEEGRARIGRVLGVDPADLRLDAAAVPLVAQLGTSGMHGVELAVAVQWAAVNIGLPVLVGLTKDAAKARLEQLWRRVIKPAIDGEDGGDKFGDELATPS